MSLFAVAAFQCGAAVYPRLEAAFSISGLATDPFDYTVTDVTVDIQQPDASIIKLPAFFDGGTTWRVRHSPQMPGTYVILYVKLNGTIITPTSLQPSAWMVDRSPVSPGFVRIDPTSSTNRFRFSDGTRYFPVGQNVAWDTSTVTNVVSILARMGAARENWGRIWMDPWDNKDLDWPSVGPFGTLSLSVAQKWDAIVSAAEQAGIYFQMTLQHHGQYSSTVDPNWPQNPYNSANGGFLSNAAQFFTNATAKALTKRKLRYAIARWGASPAIMAWELFNEVQFTDAAQAGQWSVIGAWHDEMAQFIRSRDPYAHLITTSSDVTQPIWNQCDYYTHHDYPTDLITALRDPITVPAGKPLKPIFGAESGSDLTPFYGLHAPLWSGLMGAQAGAAQPWYWDRIDAEGGYRLIRSLSDFTRLAGIPEQNSLIRATPAVSASQNSSLVFSPGGGYSAASQTTFTVGSSAPDGVGTLPSFLQGNFHRAQMNMPNGYTFNVNYPQAGTFSVQVLTIAASGASLVISVDGTTTNRLDWPNSGGDISTNITLSISVPAGAHVVRLTNPGQDWVNLGNLTLSSYVPIVGAYQIGNSNFAALWLWHRTNIYNASASSTVSGTVTMSGLRSGNYQGTWWDTFAGTSLSNFNFSVISNAPVTLAFPPVLRSLAFYAGESAQVSTSASPSTIYAGTNTPPFTIDAALANGGGLPALYSLCLTGSDVVTYVADTSAQTNGPNFAWKDISVSGLDQNFTTLTGTKTAKDEGISGPVALGFPFPFYSAGGALNLFTNIFISPNGYISFSAFGGDTSSNTPLPSTGAPTNLIAPFWDDLDLGTSGHVYTDADPFAGTFTIQYDNVRFKGTTSTATFQVILKATGEILFQYKSMAVSNACTVGIQNGDASQGLQVAYNQNVLQTNLAIRLRPVPWLKTENAAGLIAAHGSNHVHIMLFPSNAVPGDHVATFSIVTNQSATPLGMLSIHLVVSSRASWRQQYFGDAQNGGNGNDLADPDHDGLVNLVEYALGTNPLLPTANQVSIAMTGQHLMLTFKRPHPAPPDVLYVPEVTADLVNGPWQTGPAFVSQTVTDNGDGTETVVFTDLADAASSPMHFLRVRISAQ